MSIRGRLSMLGAVAIIAAACSSGGGGASATAAASAGAGASATACADAGVTPAAGGLLEKIKKAGKLVVSTDPKYPPQSELDPTSALGYKGFDIDVAAEIAKRLCVDVGFETPDWNAIIAGGWGGRWDISVGSMTITLDRSKVLDFSPPYYYTPGPDGGEHALGDHHPRRPRRQDDLLRPGHDLRRLAERHAGLRHGPGPRQAAGRDQDHDAADGP